METRWQQKHQEVHVPNAHTCSPFPALRAFLLFASGSSLESVLVLLSTLIIPHVLYATPCGLFLLRAAGLAALATPEVTKQAILKSILNATCSGCGLSCALVNGGRWTKQKDGRKRIKSVAPVVLVGDDEILQFCTLDCLGNTRIGAQTAKSPFKLQGSIAFMSHVDNRLLKRNDPNRSKSREMVVVNVAPSGKATVIYESPGELLDKIETAKQEHFKIKAMDADQTTLFAISRWALAIKISAHRGLDHDANPYIGNRLHDVIHQTSGDKTTRTVNGFTVSDASLPETITNHYWWGRYLVEHESNSDNAAPVAPIRCRTQLEVVQAVRGLSRVLEQRFQAGMVVRTAKGYLRQFLQECRDGSRSWFKCKIVDTISIVGRVEKMQTVFEASERRKSAWAPSSAAHGGGGGGSAGSASPASSAAGAGAKVAMTNAVSDAAESNGEEGDALEETWCSFSFCSGNPLPTTMTLECKHVHCRKCMHDWKKACESHKNVYDGQSYPKPLPWTCPDCRQLVQNAT